MSKHYIIGVHLHNRFQDAQMMQKLFTEYGCHIKTRLGLHEVHEGFCATSGIILMEMVGEERIVDEFIEKLKSIERLSVQRMVFEEAE